MLYTKILANLIKSQTGKRFLMPLITSRKINQKHFEKPPKHIFIEGTLPYAVLKY